MTWSLRMKSLPSRWLAAAVVSAALAGCASAPQAVRRDIADYRQRAVTRVDGGVRISTAALSAQESEVVYGVPLATKSIQPVWIEVENHDDRAYYLMSPALDPNSSVSEAAEAFVSGESREQAVELARRFGSVRCLVLLPDGVSQSARLFFSRLPPPNGAARVRLTVWRHTAAFFLMPSPPN